MQDTELVIVVAPCEGCGCPTNTEVLDGGREPVRAVCRGCQLKDNW